MLRCMSQKDEAKKEKEKRRGPHHHPRVVQCWLLGHEELVGALRTAVFFFEKATIEGPHNDREKIVLATSRLVKQSPDYATAPSAEH